jgi:hypothetical protein
MVDTIVDGVKPPRSKAFKRKKSVKKTQSKIGWLIPLAALVIVWLLINHAHRLR